MKQSDRKMAALLIIVGVLILAAIGMLVGMQIGTSRRQQIEQAQAASASAESEAKAASDAAIAQSQADLAAASAQQESEAAKQAEEESAAALLAEQTKEANRENSEVLKGIAALGVPYVSAYADAVKNAQTISAETASSTASQPASTTGTNGHELGLDEMDGEDHLPSTPTFNGIHFRDGCIRGGGQEHPEIGQAAAAPTGPVHLEGVVPAAPRGIAHLSWKIDVPGTEESCIDIVIDGLF